MEPRGLFLQASFFIFSGHQAFTQECLVSRFPAIPGIEDEKSQSRQEDSGGAGMPVYESVPRARTGFPG